VTSMPVSIGDHAHHDVVQRHLSAFLQPPRDVTERVRRPFPGFDGRRPCWRMCRCPPTRRGLSCCRPHSWSQPSGTWRDPAVRRHAHTLLGAAAALPETEHRPALRVLREALVNSGDLDAAARR
jgi:hypothetical protein